MWGEITKSNGTSLATGNDTPRSLRSLSLKLWGMSAHVPTKSLYSATICSRQIQVHSLVSNSTQQIGSFVVLNYSSLGWVNSYMIPWISMDHMWIICWGIKHPAAGSSLPVVHGDQPFPQSWQHSTCACLESQLTSCFPMDTEGRELWDCPGNS